MINLKENYASLTTGGTSSRIVSVSDGFVTLTQVVFVIFSEPK